MSSGAASGVSRRAIGRPNRPATGFAVTSASRRGRRPAEDGHLDEKPPSELELAAQGESRTPLLKDFWFFLIHEKRWWLTPIVIVLLLIGLLLWFSSSAIAPFIYTLF